MAAPTKPQKKTALGKDSWFLVPTIADQTAPTATEINAATGLNISCYLLASYGGVTQNATRVSLERLLCETSTTEGLGEVTYSMEDMTIVFDPQGAAASEGKEAFELIQDGDFTGYAVRRQGVSADTGDVTAGEFVDVIPVEIGKPLPGKSNTDASGIYTATAPVAVTGEPSFNVAVAAGV